ncbi:MAG TPA: SHOCT domain-containing protein [Ignavibacteriaceae bacterium]
MKKLSVIPGRKISAGSIPVMIFFLLFGVGFAVVVGNVLIENEAPVLFSVLFYLLISLWILTVMFLLIYNIKNLKGSEGVSLFDIHNESDAGNDSKISPAQLLRELESLKKDGLINEAEFRKKRESILNEQW